MAISPHRILYFFAGLLLGIMAPRLIYEAGITVEAINRLPWPPWVRTIAADPLDVLLVVCGLILLWALIRWCRSNGRTKFGRHHDD